MVISLGALVGGERWEDSGEDMVCMRAPEWACADGRHAHAVLPYAGERFSVVLFTHSAVYSAQSRRLLDLLIQMGMPLPEDAGTTKIIIPDAAEVENPERNAWNAYVNTCEAISYTMYHFTVDDINIDDTFWQNCTSR